MLLQESDMLLTNQKPGEQIYPGPPCVCAPCWVTPRARTAAACWEPQMCQQMEQRIPYCSKWNKSNVNCLYSTFRAGFKKKKKTNFTQIHHNFLNTMPGALSCAALQELPLLCAVPTKNSISSTTTRS